MKRYSNLVLFVLIGMLAVTCDKNEDDENVNPITLYDKVNGEWEIESLLQTDEIAKANASELSEMDLTQIFDFSTLQIKLNVNEEMEPVGFEVTGDAPALFITEGYWDLDNPFPKTDGSNNIIRLYADESKTVIIDELELVTVPGTQTVLEMQLVRKSAGSAYVSYLYSMKPVN